MNVSNAITEESDGNSSSLLPYWVERTCSSWTEDSQPENDSSSNSPSKENRRSGLGQSCKLCSDLPIRYDQMLLYPHSRGIMVHTTFLHCLIAEMLSCKLKDFQFWSCLFMESPPKAELITSRNSRDVSCNSHGLSIIANLPCFLLGSVIIFEKKIPR